MNGDSEKGAVVVVIGLILILLLLMGGAAAYFLFGRQQAALVQAEESRLAEAARMEAQRARANAEGTMPSAEIPDEEPAASDSISAAIQSVLHAQQDAWNRGDLDEFMDHYQKSDALTFSSGGKTTRGWTETLDRYRERYPTRDKMGRLTFSGLEITPLSDAAALVLGQWNLEREGDPLSGNFSLVMRKVANRWLIIHDHTSRTQD